MDNDYASMSLCLECIPADFDLDLDTQINLDFNLCWSPPLAQGTLYPPYIPKLLCYNLPSERRRRRPNVHCVMAYEQKRAECAMRAFALDHRSTSSFGPSMETMRTMGDFFKHVVDELFFFGALRNKCRIEWEPADLRRAARGVTQLYRDVPGGPRGPFVAVITMYKFSHGIFDNAFAYYTCILHEMIHAFCTLTSCHACKLRWSALGPHGHGQVWQEVADLLSEEIRLIHGAQFSMEGVLSLAYDIRRFNLPPEANGNPVQHVHRLGVTWVVDKGHEEEFRRWYESPLDPKNLDPITDDDNAQGEAFNQVELCMRVCRRLLAR